MTAHWKELLAQDRFIVRSNGLMHEYQKKIVTMLYQPLIGATANSLYMTLWSLIEKDDLWGEEMSHHSLMNVMGVDLQQIFQYRSKLEGLGLLNVFVKQEEEHKYFIYELQPPLSPEQFFTDGTLEVFLFNRLGKKRFDQLKQQFITEKISKEEYRNITKSFSEVFESLSTSELMPSASKEVIESLTLPNHLEHISEGKNGGITINEGSEPFDFQLLMDDLSTIFVPKEVITKEVKDTIIKLAYIYNISDALQMSRIIQNAFLHEQKIDLDLLKKEVQRWYQFEHENKLPFLSLRQQPKKFQEHVEKEPQTAEEKTIKEYETISPYDLLKERSGGGKPALSDLKVIESVMFEQGLLPGVVNVLVDYVLYINNLKLPKAYVEKIAAYWSRKQIRTVKEAMALAREENKKYREWLNQKSQPAKAKKRTNVREDILPKWMTEQKEKEKKTAQTEKKPSSKSNLKERLRNMK
jgi:replication initiation and membrane attachment protein